MRAALLKPREARLWRCARAMVWRDTVCGVLGLLVSSASCTNERTAVFAEHFQIRIAAGVAPLSSGQQKARTARASCSENASCAAARGRCFPVNAASFAAVLARPCNIGHTEGVQSSLLG